MTPTTITVSVVIPARDAEGVLGGCLESLQSQDPPPWRAGRDLFSDVLRTAVTADIDT